MHPLVNVAVTASRKAGNLILRGAEKRESLNVSSKQHNDFVTEVDQAAERIIIDEIQRSYPQHDILGEESGSIVSGDKAGDVEWVIDPIDGTTNFIHGVPHFCVSIGIREKGRLEHGVIFDPVKNELFTTSRGRGATLDGKRLRMARHTSLEGRLIGCGLPFRKTDDIELYLNMIRNTATKVASTRASGSSALDLAYVAAGRYDGFWEVGLKPWDIAAGALMVQEAGGIVGDIDGGTNFMESCNVVAGSPKVFAALVRELQIAKKG